MGTTSSKLLPGWPVGLGVALSDRGGHALDTGGLGLGG